MRKYSYGLLILLPFLMIACGNKETSLFNGENLDGWYAYQADSGKHLNADEVFEVKDGIIQMYGEKSGYLMSEKSYENFDLTLQFRWNTDAALPRRIEVKNSGVMYLVPENATDMLWPKGIQFQVKEGGTGDFILLQNVELTVKGKDIEPGESVVVERFEDAEKPVGEWNTLEIISENGNIKQKLNGKLVNEGENSSVRKGRILLQYEGYPIDFQNIKIKEL